jgi:hypothetical protein
MEKEFIPYEQALSLKELGFDEPCFATYRKDAVASKKPFEFDLDYHTKVQMQSNIIPINSEYTEESKWISAPTFSQSFRWFREKYGLYGVVASYFGGAVFGIEDKNKNYHNKLRFKTHEEAELECLKKLIEIVKEK